MDQRRSDLGDESGALTTDDVRDLLRTGPVHFVIADIGHALRWVPDEETYECWKEEVSPHVLAPDRPTVDLPGGLGYWASLWQPTRGADPTDPIVLLEATH